MSRRQLMSPGFVRISLDKKGEARSLRRMVMRKASGVLEIVSSASSPIVILT